jgi:DNA replication protein DnaC
MTILRPAVADSLRALKLSGMLETLDARLAQAQGGDLGYLEFLQILCDDEITRREQAAMGRRLRRARFDTETTLEGFDFSANPKLPAAQIRDLAALRWLQAGESIILYGAVGVGKTHVAQAMGTSCDPGRCRGPVPQDQPDSGRPGRRPCRPHLRQAPGLTRQTRPADLG